MALEQKIHGIRQFLSVSDTLWPHYYPSLFHSLFIHKISKLAYAISATKSQQLLMLMWTRTAKLILLSASYPFACLVLLCNVRIEWLSRGRFCGCWDWIKSMCHVAGVGLYQTQHGGQWRWRGQWGSQSRWAFSKLHRKQLLSTVQPHFTLYLFLPTQRYTFTLWHVTVSKFSYHDKFWSLQIDLILKNLNVFLLITSLKLFSYNKNNNEHLITKHNTQNV